MRSLFTVLLLIPLVAHAEEFVIQSPDRELTATLHCNTTITLGVSTLRGRVFTVSDIALRLRNATVPDNPAAITQIHRDSADRIIVPDVKEEFASLHESFNELRVFFRDSVSLHLRAYNEGIAYRFATARSGSLIINSEQWKLRFSDGDSAYYQTDTSFWSAYESPYRNTAVNRIDPGIHCLLPMLVQAASGDRVLVTESDVADYPRLRLRTAHNGVLEPFFAGYPLQTLTEARPYFRGKVLVHADYIAQTRGPREFPWRAFLVARDDAHLVTNPLVYLLGKPTALHDASWITPGTVTIDWWGRWNLFGVDFIGGVNTATAKYFIDFASRFGVHYFLLDEGWSNPNDLFAVTPDLDLPEVLRYARAKDVRIILWAVWTTFEQQRERALSDFERWGVSGIKVDFMNRDDQEIVNFYQRTAAEAAAHHLLVDFHGAYAPDGLRRTFPNVITQEGLIEFEFCGVNDVDSPWYHTVLPFIRMVAGPADYLPGTLNNAQKQEFRVVPNRPMGQGTRAHSMALCVVLKSPMRMLPDSPADYLRDSSCTSFMAGVPVEWEDSRVLHAHVGEYLTMARKWHGTWYIGSITNWAPRDVTLQLDFLDEGKEYTLHAFGDGLNADKRAIDFQEVRRRVHRGDSVAVHLAPGGGWVGSLQAVKGTRP